LQKAARKDLSDMISKSKVSPVLLEENNTGLADDINNGVMGTARGPQELQTIVVDDIKEFNKG